MLSPLGRHGELDPRRRRLVAILYGEGQPALGYAMRAAMAREGFQDTALFTSLPPLLAAVKAGEADLLVLDTDLPGGDACAAIRDIREGRVGPNPFVAAIATTFNPSVERVRMVVDSGADDLIVKPMSPEQLLLRMSSLVSHRKPFVVTSDYIGPDRRPGPDAADGLPRFDVPNTLRAKVRGEAVLGSELRSAIADALKEINEQRLHRHSLQVGFLVRLILPAYLQARADAGTAAHVDRLAFVAEDAVRRLKGTRFEHVGELCSALRTVALSIARDHPCPGEKDLALLPRLSDAMLVGFNPASDTARLADEIARAVDRYAARPEPPRAPQVATA